MLGHILALRAGMDYESLVKARITGPLGHEQHERHADAGAARPVRPGTRSALKPVKGWDLPTLAGAGALRSSANDMLTFLAAEIGYTQSPLAPAMKAMLQPRRPAGAPGLEIALAWHVFTANGQDDLLAQRRDRRLSHLHGLRSGRPHGSRRARERVEPRRPGRHRPAPPRSEEPAAGREVAGAGATEGADRDHVAAATFDRYVGRYQFAPTAFLIVTRDGNRFMAQLTGQAAYEVFAET